MFHDIVLDESKHTLIEFNTPPQRVVANTFHDIVLDESKHTLIEFYSPYCSHCKQLIPVYNDLASRVSNNYL